MGDVIKDKRFSHVSRDPRFRKMKRQDRKVKIDERFKGMFKDKKFKVKYVVDKRGRPVNTSSAENLRKYYDVSSDESGSGDSDYDNDESSSSDETNNANVKLKPNEKTKTKKSKEVAKQVKQLMEKDEEADEESGSESDRSDGSVPKPSDDAIQMDAGIDYARGKAMMESSSESSSDEESDSEESKESEIEHDWGKTGKEAPEAEEITPRLALCNMDWDRLSATDLMVMLNSFKPTGGVIKSVTVYPSEFGLRRMKEEELKGPTELSNLNVKNKKVADIDESEQGSEYHTEKLRQYQLNRLKYYYAVVECDSADTANHIYSQCDGLEFETSANKLDLRFIPNGMTFDQEAKSVATEMPDISTYKPTAFFNLALQNSTVECTWDEDNQRRIQVTRRKLKPDELEDLDLREYLASDSDADEDQYGDLIEDPSFEAQGENSESDNEDSIEKYRKLVDLVSKKEKSSEDKPDVDMEITWDIGVKENAEKLVAKQKDDKELTPWDRYLKKKKEKRKQKKEEWKQAQEEKRTAAIENSDDSHVNDNLSSDDDLPSDVDLNDPYFKEALEEMKGESKRQDKKKKKKQKDGESKDEKEKQKELLQAELGLLMMDEDDQKQHFNLDKLIIPENESKTKRKKRLKKEAEEKAKNGAVVDTFEMNLDDPRFKALYQNPLYNIDPTAPQFRKTQNTDMLVKEKVKRSTKKRKENPADKDDVVKKQKFKEKETLQVPKEQSIDSLIKSVKSKTKNFRSQEKNETKQVAGNTRFRIYNNLR